MAKIGFFRVRKTIGGSSAKLGKKSQDAYLLVFKKVKSPILADSQDFEHILALPDSLSAFIDLQIALSDVETDEVPLDDVQLDEIPDAPLPEQSAAVNADSREASELAQSAVGALEKENTEKVRAIKNELCKYAVQRLRPALPLLIGCHSNDPKLVHLCLEGLHHFVMIGTCSTLGKTVDPVLDCFLTGVFEGSLACWASCLRPLLDILMKIMGTYETIPQSSLMCMITVLSSLHGLVYRLEDAGYNVKDHVFELLTTALNSIMSLIQVPSSESEKLETEGTLNMDDALLSYASKMESLGVGSIEALSMDMLQLSSLLYRSSRWQNSVMYLLLLVYHCRRYGRVGGVKGG